ncbi:MAG TPA: 4-alpha-glucanotransferase, partial [Gemmatimonadota bacterium]|nr:4-alpha-glucanotransferase [Gemmatimonadota bacterium]
PAGWQIALRLPAERGGGRVAYEAQITTEDGVAWEYAGRVTPRTGADTANLRLPSEAGAGYHQLRVEVGGIGTAGESTLIVAPSSCLTVSELLDKRRRFGIWHHLYRVRSRSNWGAGDLGDLRDLVEWSGKLGAAFVGLNPLHALRNRGDDISPYSPVSRLFRNELYIEIAAIPELAGCDEARSWLESREHREALARASAADRVLYKQVMSLKKPVLDLLHREFVQRHGGGDTDRGREYRRYLERNGKALSDFATFIELEAHFEAQGLVDWRKWPAAYRDPNSVEVEAFRQERGAQIDRHRWVQFELDCQLDSVAGSARESGLEIGLYGDLAIGSAPNGSDTWAFPGLFLAGASIGAPPDDYSLEGQDWGLPPLDPRRLRVDGYRYWIILVRNALRRMGALRIDHVMGLLRQYWVPAGRPATEGAYVRYPVRDLLGVLALESRRAGALVIGEDLGTVPRGFPALLSRWGILSSGVLYFERDAGGGYRAPSRYSPRAMVTANTHDNPPLLGFWKDRDLELRHAAGELQAPGALDEAKTDRKHEREALVRRLRREGCLDSTRVGDPYPALAAAVHSLLAKTPAPLVGASLDDLCGESDPINLPGIQLDRYPSWSRRQRRSLEELKRDDGVARALGGLRERARRAPGS